MRGQLAVSLLFFPRLESKSVKNKTTNSFAGYRYLPILKLIWITQANRLYKEVAGSRCTHVFFTLCFHPSKSSCKLLVHEPSNGPAVLLFVLTLSQSNEI
jgi:hypothetical protein